MRGDYPGRDNNAMPILRWARQASVALLLSTSICVIPTFVWGQGPNPIRVWASDSTAKDKIAALPESIDIVGASPHKDSFGSPANLGEFVARECLVPMQVNVASRTNNRLPIIGYVAESNELGRTIGFANFSPIPSCELVPGSKARVLQFNVKQKTIATIHNAQSNRPPQNSDVSSQLAMSRVSHHGDSGDESKKLEESNPRGDERDLIAKIPVFRRFALASATIGSGFFLALVGTGRWDDGDRFLSLLQIGLGVLLEAGGFLLLWRVQ